MTKVFWHRCYRNGPFFLLLFSFMLSGCQSWSERGAKGEGTLPKASPGETNFSSYQPTHPYQQITKGLLGRKMYETSAQAGVVIEVHDLLVGPNQRTDSYALEAPAIFEVKSGSGVMKLGDKSQQIQAGTVLTLSAAQAFTIENQSDVAVAIKAEVLGRK